MQDLLIKPAQADELSRMLVQYASSISKDDELAVIDWPGCVAMCGGEEEGTREILRLCAEDLDVSKANIQTHYAAKNTEALRDELHKIRGGVCYLKLPELEHTLKTFHMAVKAKSQDIIHLEETYQALEKAEQRFLAMCVEKGFVSGCSNYKGIDLSVEVLENLPEYFFGIRRFLSHFVELNQQRPEIYAEGRCIC